MPLHVQHSLWGSPSPPERQASDVSSRSSFSKVFVNPVIFKLGTNYIGRHTKKRSALIVMGVGGGAWYPPAQGSIADRNTRISYLVPFSEYAAMAIYAIGIVIDQAIKGGFRFKPVDEIEQRKAELVEVSKPADQESSEDLEKKDKNIYVEVA